MNQVSLKTALAGLRTLPTLARVHERLVAVLDDPRSTLTTIGTMVRTDPVVTAHLLQAANASRAPGGERVLTVTRAIRLIGVEVVRRLVDAQASALIRATDVGVREVEGLWRHALAAAFAAQALGRARGYPDPEEFYVAGLLHDLGKLTMVSLFPERFLAMRLQAEQTHQSFYRCEVDSGELSHAKVGRLLAQEWSVPTAYVDTMAWHHTPQLAGTYRKVVAAAHVGDILARALDIGSGGDPLVPPLHVAAQQALDLRVNEVRTIMSEAETETERAIGLFD